MTYIQTIVSLFCLAFLFGCDKPHNSGAQNIQLAEPIGTDEISVIRELLDFYAWEGSDTARPGLLSHIGFEAPSGMDELQSMYGARFGGDDLRQLHENSPETFYDLELVIPANLIDEALADLQDANRESVTVVQIGDLPTLPAKKLQDLMVVPDDSRSGDFWGSFEREFPEAYGFSAVSRVGFSRDRSVALVHFSWLAGPTLGLGCVHVLEHTAEGWRVAGRWRQLGWVS